MPIPNVETLLIMERIKSEALAKAFEEVAVLLAGRIDHGHYRALNKRLVEVVERMPVIPLKYAAGVEIAALDQQMIKQNAIGLTIHAIDDAFKLARKRLRR
ncbi:hypothetical protein [Brucella pituitosa]|uniref:Uncharacterized protein n=1 Tax=Brucella pituitosa TaxID=571256 RepID=A0A643EZL8_9HYPH|nr:hypothetical protein [Brucella pituitosa]KAB0571252.1 hypothetical protein F7Q93_11035 [Brucella pituitosa]